MKNLKFYRSMSLLEYKNHESRGRIIETEWAEPNLEREQGGVSISLLKRWVDEGKNSKGPHDLVIEVDGSVPNEFSLRPAVYPFRYINNQSIDFERVTIVYDPRSLVLNEPDLTLERIISPNSCPTN